MRLFRKKKKLSNREQFIRDGMRPWTLGYQEYKEEEIVRALRERTLGRGELPPGFGHRIDERIIEYPWLFSRLPAEPGALLDAGSTLNFEYLLSQPALASKKIDICTLAPEPNCFWSKGISYVFADLRQLPYRDEWFDWIVCLSTIEHVGMDNSFLYTGGVREPARPEDYLAAAHELRRVLKPGGTVYISVPFGKAADMRWYQVFDQKMVEAMTAAFAPTQASSDYFKYTNEGWTRSTAAGTADATVFDIHNSKGYDPDFAAAARAVCCVELRK